MTAARSHFDFKGVFMSLFNVLCLGDVVGEDAVARLKAELPRIIKENNVHCTVINGENALMGRGNGISPDIADTLFFAGADFITGGNHSFASSSVYSMLDDEVGIIRPANYPPECPGTGYCIKDLGAKRVLVMNVSGRIYMNESLSDPFLAVSRILENEKGNYDLSILDLHAEATSEKICIASYFDGKIDIIFGTHTHVPTADLKLLPLGSAYITDLGLCGPENSSLGVKTEIATKKIRTGMPVRFELSRNPVKLEGAIFTLDGGKISALRQVRF